MSGRYHHIFREPEGADTAVLLLHGILSAPQYFRFLLDDIPQEYAVSGILLEGHGGDSAALAETDMQAWKQQVQAQYRRLSAKYPHIIIAAHSMGTLFALQLAAEHPQQIDAMLLLNVPLYAHLTAYGAFWGALIGAGMQPEPQCPRVFAMKQAFSLRPTAQAARYLKWIPRYQELFREMQHTRSILHRVTVPCAAFQSAQDELVALRSLPLLKANPAVRLHVLRESSHFYYPEADEARILRAWKRMLHTNRKSQREIPLKNDEKERKHMKFYQNKETGEIVTEACPGYEEIIPNTVDAAREKHVPVISREGQTVTVTVGETLHPMLDNHYIGWILLETKNGEERKELKPGEEPVAQFFAAEDDEIVAAYAYCNLHGLWKA